MRFFCAANDDTIKAGEDFGKKLSGGEVVLLSGDLGAGKTTFTKGIAKALKIDEEILSPTFTLMNEYFGALNLCHIDAYRLKNGEEAVFAGIAERIGGENSVSVIEWWQNIETVLPKNAIRVQINYAGSGREIEIEFNE